FVCLGNICRSPMAEGLFQHLVEEAGWSDRFEIDSAGTSAYHTGERADSRMRYTAAENGIALTSLARQFVKQDLNDFDYIMAMDRSNFSNILDLKKPGANSHAIVRKMRDFDPQPGSLDVPDPYYGGAGGFQEVYDILLRSNQKFLEFLQKTHAL
ncbi:MAG TPA: low molecular weight phosphotyrosine protein phosphatase, partial [Bacteroidetes bacterium]|nr:low molecular weight phosphotyrosine protein phosphatase [Bacteroidota bacterium]